MPNHSPDTVLGSDQFGDDAGRRFRYQYGYAATVCCLLLDESEDAAEVFCEHHEDITIKTLAGRFRGLQVKTREIDQPAWKTSDDAVRASFARFVEIDTDYPDAFEAFRFLTNHPLHAAQNGQSLPFVLDSVRRATSKESLTSNVLDFLKKVAKRSNRSEEQVFDTLQKSEAADTLPKLADIILRLLTTLDPLWDRVENLSYSQFLKAANNLVQECGKASTLAHENTLPGYLPATSNPSDGELTARIAGKRFTRDRVIKALEDGLVASELLDGELALCPAPGDGDEDRLLKKLDVGGFSYVARNSAQNLRNKADYLGLKWSNKLGNDRGRKRYDHVLSVVLAEAGNSFEATKRNDAPFGIEMLNELRDRLNVRRGRGTDFFDASDDHLEGFAYSLSSQCKVVWSNERPWEEES